MGLGATVLDKTALKNWLHEFESTGELVKLTIPGYIL